MERFSNRDGTYFHGRLLQRVIILGLLVCVLVQFGIHQSLRRGTTSPASAEMQLGGKFALRSPSAARVPYSRPTSFLSTDVGDAGNDVQNHSQLPLYDGLETAGQLTEQHQLDDEEEVIWSLAARATSPAKNGPVTVDMEQVYDAMDVGDPDGGAWKQGWDVKYGPEMTDNVLNVFLVPHSHNDPGWIKTYDDYYFTETRPILNTIVDALAADNRRRFIWAEISYLSRWWDEQPPTRRELLRQLIKNGQFEVVTGGWVMNDEANTNVAAMVSQLLEGHQWLGKTLGVKPEYGWAIDPFGHTPTMAYFLKRMGFKGMLIQRVYYNVKKRFARQRGLEFRWRQTWDLDGHTDMFCHMMPFYSYDVPHTCGPDPSVCCQFDFKRTGCPWGISPTPINDDNVASRARMLLDQYRKKSTLFQTKNVLIPLGDDFRFMSHREAEAQFTNYQRLFDHMNSDLSLKVHARFATLRDYFVAIADEVVSDVRAERFPVLAGDFFTYADKTDEFWSGYYVSRSFYKAMDRAFEPLLRAAEVAYTLASASSSLIQVQLGLSSMWNELVVARRNLGLFQHHDGITGTARKHVALDYGNRMVSSMRHLDKMMAQLVSAFASFGGRDVHKSVGTLHSLSFKAAGVAESQVLGAKALPTRKVVVLGQRVMVYNALAHARVEIRSVILAASAEAFSACVLNSHGTVVRSEVHPLLDISHIQASAAYTFVHDKVELFYEVEVPALGVSVFTVVARDESLECKRSPPARVTITTAVTPTGLPMSHPFEIVVSSPGSGPMQSRQLQVEFESNTGLLRRLRWQSTMVDIVEEFAAYQTQRSGAYLFLPLSSTPSQLLAGRPLRIGCAVNAEHRGLVQQAVTTLVGDTHGISLVRVARLYNSAFSSERAASQLRMPPQAVGLELCHWVDMRRSTNQEVVSRLVKILLSLPYLCVNPAPTANPILSGTAPVFQTHPSASFSMTSMVLNQIGDFIALNYLCKQIFSQCRRTRFCKMRRRD